MTGTVCGDGQVPSPSFACMWFESIFEAPIEQIVWWSGTRGGEGQTQWLRQVAGEKPVAFRSAGQLAAFCKALFFDHRDEAVDILMRASPEQQAKAAQLIGRSDSEVMQWHEVSKEVTAWANRWKFSSNEGLRARLELAEDQFLMLRQSWGCPEGCCYEVCGCSDCRKGLELGKTLRQIKGEVGKAPAAGGDG